MRYDLQLWKPDERTPPITGFSRKYPPLLIPSKSYWKNLIFFLAINRGFDKNQIAKFCPKMYYISNFIATVDCEKNVKDRELICRNEPK
jgi:hypothetical protein